MTSFSLRTSRVDDLPHFCPPCQLENAMNRTLVSRIRSRITQPWPIVGLLVGLLMACGGGDPTSAPPARAPQPATGDAPNVNGSTVYIQTPSPEVPGVFGGRLERDTNPDFIFVVTDAWDKRLFYGTTSERGFSVAGFMILGGNWWTSADPTIYNGRDWGAGEAVHLQTSHDAAIPSISGTLRFRGDEPISLSGGPISESTYNYNAAPSLSMLTGSWTLLDTQKRIITVEVQPDGTVSSEDGCGFSGRIVPDSSGNNLFRVSLDAPCFAEQGLSQHEGFALAMPLRSGATQLLFYVEANNGIDWTAVVATGMR